MSTILKSHVGELFKVAKLAIVQVLGYMEDKCTFSTVAFSKSKLRNWLSNYLAAHVGIFSHKFIRFHVVYDEWHIDWR